MKKTILLTGATGFLGSHLLEALLNNNYQVVILKRSFSDAWRINHLIDNVKSYDLDKDPLEHAFKDQPIDVVIHLATLYRKFDKGKEVSEMIASNVTFPVEIIECGIRHGLKGFINTGTFFEYDCSVLPVREDAPFKPFNLYAKTKLAFENILVTYSSSISTMTLRLFSLYGEKDNAKLIPMLIQKALKKETMELSDGLQKLDFVYSADIIDAYLKALNVIHAFKPKHQVFNIGSGSPVSVREVVSILEQQLGTSVKKTWGKPSEFDISIVFADISRARKDLSWKPEHSIHEGMEKTIRYYAKRNETWR
ncbi:NAD-dependent epimerase/dehydratase family protein [Desulfonatronovibrio magnus]|uniref:NAD-dependent epimerase/dehydratase family protein n=1 Tax=Desulfonatronovibrio magnus TaxID=698827 RepID=UPI0005EBDFE3|nr:NAD(P)-dependent oxidoreductase [Desulfonatronovibrio magnus]